MSFEISTLLMLYEINNVDHFAVDTSYEFQPAKSDLSTLLTLKARENDVISTLSISYKIGKPRTGCSIDVIDVVPSRKPAKWMFINVIDVVRVQKPAK